MCPVRCALDGSLSHRWQELQSKESLKGRGRVGEAISNNSDNSLIFCGLLSRAAPWLASAPSPCVRFALAVRGTSIDVSSYPTKDRDGGQAIDGSHTQEPNPHKRSSWRAKTNRQPGPAPTTAGRGSFRAPSPHAPFLPAPAAPAGRAPLLLSPATNPPSSGGRPAPPVRTRPGRSAAVAARPSWHCAPSRAAVLPWRLTGWRC